MTKNEQVVFEDILEKLGFGINDVDNGLYIITHPETIHQSVIQTNGFNLRYSVRALINSKIYEEICL